MIDYGIVESADKPLEITEDKYSIYLATNIQEIQKESEQSEEPTTLYTYNLKRYDKTESAPLEYIKYKKQLEFKFNRDEEEVLPIEYNGNFYDYDEKVVREGLFGLINSIREANSKTKIIIVPPVKIKANILDGIFSMYFNLESVEKIEKSFGIYKEVAKANGCYYIDFNEAVKPSELDGLHYSKDSHKIIACKVATFIKLNKL